MQLELSSVAKWKGDVVIVEPIEVPRMIGHIHVPDNYTGRKDDSGQLWKGEVKAFGDDIDREVPGWKGIKVGDRVWIRAYALNCPSFKTKQGKENIAIRQEDVMLVEEVAA